MKITIDEIHEYLEQWYNHDQWTDFNMAWDSGYTELAASMISDAGAIDSTNCYEDSQPIEKAIEKLLKNYSNKERDRDSNSCFKNAEVYINPDTNEHAFIRNQDVDYLVSEEEMLRYHYVPLNEYYKYAEVYELDKSIILNI
jgi:hypothetical protein